MSLPAVTTAVRSGFAALRTNPLRTILSALGVVIGIGAMIAVLALSDGVETSFRQQLAADGRAQTLQISPRTMDFVDGLPMARTNVPVFTLSDADALSDSIGSLGTVDLATSGQGMIVVAPGRPGRGTMLRGTRVAPAAIRANPPAAGRFFTNAELRQRAHVLVVSDALAAALAATLTDSTAGPETRALILDAPSRRSERAAGRTSASRPRPTAAACRALVGRTVTLRDIPWTIIGVLPPASNTETECTGQVPTPARFGPNRSLFRQPIAFVPLSVVADATMPPAPGMPTFGMSATPSFTLVATRIEDLKPLRARAERWLAQRYGATQGDSGGWKERVQVASYEQESEGIGQAMLVFKLLMSAITGISLVVGGVGIMNVLLATVTERTREIGISKAVGARRRDVLMQYLAESVAISIMGAILGTALGYGIAQLVAAIMRSQATIPVHAGFSLSTLLVAIGAPLLVGVTFGMYPALRAARLSPIDAIRHE